MIGKTDPWTLEEQLRDTNFLRYQEYAEISLQNPRGPESYCHRCAEPRRPLTYRERDVYYLPCWDCLGSRKLDIREARAGIDLNIKDYYSRVQGDRYLQLYLIDDIYFQNTFPHDYSEFKKVLGKLDLPDRKDIWFLDWVPGFPKLVCTQNIQGLKIVNLSKLYNIQSSGKILQINDYQVNFPETTKYDVRHHARYNVINPESDRRTKRLRIPGTPDCVKFYNNQGPSKSIFRITRQGKEVNLEDIEYQDLVVLKLCLLRNKVFLKQIYDIVYEILDYTGTYKDAVFLKNTITLDPTKTLGLTLTWTPLDKLPDNNINISIL